MSQFRVEQAPYIVSESSPRVKQAESTCPDLKDEFNWYQGLSHQPVTRSPEYGEYHKEPVFEDIATEAPQALFNSCSSVTEPGRAFPSELWRSISLEYFLKDCSENSPPRSTAGIDLSPRDVRELLRQADKEAKPAGNRYSRAELPGLMVIDCFSMRVVDAEPGCEYVALSYVWGSIGSHPEADASHFDPDLSRCHLPQTIQDAINVVRVLGKQFLWVDRYCINSTEPGTQHFMISNMDAIYEAAYLTIIAASGSDGEHGLPSVSGLSRALGEGNVPPWDGLVYAKLSHLCLDSYVRLGQIETSAWSTRGWTYQEGLLSRRRLIFTDDWAILQHREEDRVRASSGIFAHINEYTRRHLTYPSDSLNAFRGVLRAYERLCPAAVHVWGVPFLLGSDGVTIRQPGYGLLWSANRRRPLRRVPGMPSWSWAAWIWSDDFTAKWEFDKRHFPIGPYHWLVERARSRGETRKEPSWGPSDISLELMVGSQLIHISDYFCRGPRLPFGRGLEPAPILYLTAWSTAVTAFLSPTLPVWLKGGDVRTSIITLDQTAENLCAGKAQVDGRWVCEWTAVLICWGIRFPTQLLLLEPVGEDSFRRVGVLETEWNNPDADDDYSVVLRRDFVRKRFRIV